MINLCRAGLYASDREMPELRRYCLNRGWTVVAQYVCGRLSQRPVDIYDPEFKSLLGKAFRRDIDILAVSSVENLFSASGGSMVSVASTMEEIHAFGVVLVLKEGSFDTSTSFGRLACDSLMAVHGAGYRI